MCIMSIRIICNVHREQYARLDICDLHIDLQIILHIRFVCCCAYCLHIFSFICKHEYIQKYVVTVHIACPVGFEELALPEGSARWS